MPTQVALRPADDDLDYVECLLAEHDLPTDDVRAGPGEFYVALADAERVGVGGLERHDPAGLLRSVAVEESVRGDGYGTAICDELETRAREGGIDALYLLTTTARDFFADRGYRVIDREEVPGEVRETTEFSDLCPRSATCMAKRLDG